MSKLIKTVTIKALFPRCVDSGYQREYGYKFEVIETPHGLELIADVDKLGAEALIDSGLAVKYVRPSIVED